MDDTWLESLKSGDMDALAKFYEKYRQEFLAMIKSKYRVSGDDALDIYQVTTLRFYNNVVTGKVSMLHDSIKPYLFSIGINVYREMVRTEMKVPLRSSPLEWAEEKLVAEDGREAAVLKDSLLEATARAIEKLGDPCKSILTKFYYFKASMQQLMEEFGYKNEATTKNKKYKCLQQLRELLLQEKVKLAIA